MTKKSLFLFLLIFLPLAPLCGGGARWWWACSDGAAAAAGKQAAFVDTNGGAQLHATTA